MSQGCVIALATYLRFEEGVLGGVIGASGSHVALQNTENINSTEKKKTPLLLYHGSKDPWPIYLA